MRTVGLSEKTVFDLMSDLRDETKGLIRQEIELAKTEMAEKASQFGRNAAWLAIGGFIAYAGFMVFLVGLGFLVGFLFQKMDMPPALADFIGIAIIGVGSAALGFVFLWRALNRLSKESIVPEKTLHTIKEIRGADNGALSRARPAAAKPSSTEMETLINSTQGNLKETATELRQRLTARYVAKQLVVQAKCHPLRSGLIAVGTSLADSSSSNAGGARHTPDRSCSTHPKCRATNLERGNTRSSTIRVPLLSGKALILVSELPPAGEVAHSLCQRSNMKSKWLGIFKETFREFSEDKVMRLGAALAYYSIFSLGPLLIIAVGVAGLLFGQDTVRKQLSEQISSLVGSGGAQMVESMMAARSKDASWAATILGIIILLFGASGVFGQLQDALNTIWEVKAKPGQGIWGFIRNRFLSMVMVLGTGFLLLISLVLTTILTALSGYAANIISIPESVMHLLNFLLSFVVITLLFAMIFKFLPDVKVEWRDVWVGGVGTALLFAGGKYLLGLYLGRESVASPYGAAGSFVVILLWIYYSSLILFLGAEFTQVYAKATGSRIVPTGNAVAVTEDKREEQGIPHEEPAAVPSYAMSNQTQKAERRNGQRAADAYSRREPQLSIDRHPWRLASLIVFAFVAPLVLRKAALRSAKYIVEAVGARRASKRHAIRV